MSIKNDVEKMYRDDMEKNKKNKAKKKNKRFAVLIIILIILIGLILLMNYLGLGFGFGKGTGKKSDSDAASVSQSESVSDSSNTEYVDIKVSGSTYLYDGNEIELEKFIETLQPMKDNVVVKIIDDNATKQAMDDLKKAVENSGRSYVKQTIEDSSDNESSKE